MTLQGGAQLMARFRALEKAPEMMMKDITINGVREAKLIAEGNKKTGNLQASIRPSRYTRTLAEIKAGGTRKAGYARSIELGARPHIIRAKPGGVLAYGGARRLSGKLRAGASATNFATFVHHPGNRPYPYLVPGLQIAARKEGLKAVAKIWNDAA